MLINIKLVNLIHHKDYRFRKGVYVEKFLKVILILLVIFIGIMLGSIILNKTYHTEFKSLDNTD
ncbi:hypothetical protein bwei_2527 [Bacillus mycoides]|nr:hypothetical protein bwei_2527 [Bacillus mycoides]EEL06070.1 hypothetical protein bcere0014_23090 [Bacillus cereus BDRD-ST196]GAE38362.1 hypothetical protein BW1_005_02400 [Bacillus mycoides NBRC 101238 = DSM 11821]